MTILASSKPAIHFPIALLLFFGFKQPAQADPAVQVTQTLTASESLTEFGIQIAASPTPKPAEALFERAIQIAEAIPTFTERTQALLTIARRLLEVNQVSRSQQLIE